MVSENLRNLIEEWLAEARASYPGALNSDGSGVMICGGPGGAAFIRPDGSLDIEPADDDPFNPWLADPVGVRHSSLRIGAKRRPALAELLPPRPDEAKDCTKCAGTGWEQIGQLEIVCHTCHGLGWDSPHHDV
jgi:hypothetical protein